jgi:exopolysaccharide biosynthesis polyprenyl glycosylphosphotransferase
MTPPPRSLNAPPEKSTDASFFLTEVILGIAALGDLLFLFAGLCVAFYFRFYSSAFMPLGLTFADYGGHFIFAILLFLTLATRMGLYARANVLKLRRIGILLINTLVMWALLYLFLSLLFSFRPPISRLFVVFSAVWGFVFVLFWRALFHTLLQRSPAAERLRQRILVVGWNREVDDLARGIQHDASHPYHIMGCLPSAHNEYRLEPPPHVPRLGDYNQVEQILASAPVDLVLIGDLDPKTREIIALCETCERAMVQFKIVPTYFPILLSGLHLETISGIPVLGVAKLPLSFWFNRVFKRAIDIVGALVGLVFAAPLILVFGWLVRRESPGPIFFAQLRKGRKGRPFTMYKIRSMHPDAAQSGGHWTSPDDKRRLRIGTFMRRWNIDEVPQFWNVLVGEMSLVGPRPELFDVTKDLQNQIRHYNVRHSVKPGLTGWAQINGLRGLTTSLDERVRHDLFYLENWNPVLDFYIMFMTFLRNGNSY